MRLLCNFKTKMLFQDDACLVQWTDESASSRFKFQRSRAQSAWDLADTLRRARLATMTAMAEAEDTVNQILVATTSNVGQAQEAERHAPHAIAMIAHDHPEAAMEMMKSE